MPRVTNPPRSSQSHKTSKPQSSSPFKIPLNDDRQEKAVRLQSRQALHDLQLNQIKAAASPMRKQNNREPASNNSPRTPQGRNSSSGDILEDGNLLAVIPGNSMTPLKRVPILANFEEWMKMATDNKINASNSWNFALIDYFYDMSLLKEGDGVNFQKASCTLDGCVKIYTSRVDSVATETGKLLSGLADSGSKKEKQSKERSEESDGEDADEEDGAKPRAKKRTLRSSGATLAASFAPLQLKKFELEFSIDPLFKKASADFDEGGAKGLLLNNLAIDPEGRIVFDSSDDTETGETAETGYRTDSGDKHAPTTDNDVETEPAGADLEDDMNIDLAELNTKFFPEMAVLDGQDVCPSLSKFDLGDPGSGLSVPLLKEPDTQLAHELTSLELKESSNPLSSNDEVNNFDDDDYEDYEDGLLGAGFVGSHDAAFGEGGEAWVKDAALESQIGTRMDDTDNAIDEAVEDAKCHDSESSHYGVLLPPSGNKVDHEGILSYFDSSSLKNWAGPEHWKIRKFRDANSTTTNFQAKRREKDPFEIDFSSPLDQCLAETLYAPASSTSSISLPKAQWASKSRNLLPDDKRFNSRELLRLFLKPRARLTSRKQGSINSSDSRRLRPVQETSMDVAFWAQQGSVPRNDEMLETKAQGNYDANFFQDDGLAFPSGAIEDDDDDFADARENFSIDNGYAENESCRSIDNTLSGQTCAKEDGYGSQLVTQNKRIRPDYVQYARVAKKVDVRRLKEEMWKGIGSEKNPPEHISLSESSSLESSQENMPMMFTTVMNGLQKVYPKQAMTDISTSYCFICLLHLANEKGLTLNNLDGLEELSIQKGLGSDLIVSV